MPRITDLVLTFGEALAPSGYKRVSNLGGTIVSISESSSGAQEAFIWIQLADENDQVILEDLRLVEPSSTLDPIFSEFKRLPKTVCVEGISTEVLVKFGEGKQGFVDGIVVEDARKEDKDCELAALDQTPRHSDSSSDNIQHLETLFKTIFTDAPHLVTRRPSLDSDLHALLKVIDIVIQDFLSASNSESNTTRLNLVLKNITEHLFSLVYENTNLFAIVNKILQQISKYLVFYISNQFETVDTSVFDILEMLLGANQRSWPIFQSFSSCEKNDPDGIGRVDLMLDATFASVANLNQMNFKKDFSSGNSRYLIVSDINCFGTLGGFVAIKHQIELNKCSLSSLSRYAAIFKQISENPALNTEYFGEFFQVTTKSIQSNIIASAKSDFKIFSEPKAIESIESLIEVLSDTLKRLKIADADKLGEVFSLELSKLLLSSPFLNLRMRAIQNFTSFTKMASSGFSLSRISSQLLNQKSDATFKWVTQKYFNDWIVQNQIFHILFGLVGDGAENTNSLHVHIIRRSSEFVLYLFRCRLVSEKDVALLFSKQLSLVDGSKLSLERKETLNILGDSAQYMTTGLLRECCKYIKSIRQFVSAGTLEDALVVFTFQISKACVNTIGLPSSDDNDFFYDMNEIDANEDISEIYGFGLLWELSIEDKSPPKLAVVSHTYLSQLLCLSESSHLYSIYLKKIMNEILQLGNIKPYASLFQVLVAERAKSFGEVSNLLSQIVSQYDFRVEYISKLLESFSRASQLVFFEQHMSFLHYLFSATKSMMSFDIVERFWNTCFVQDSNVLQQYIIWVSKLFTFESLGSIITRECVASIFSKLVCQLFRADIPNNSRLTVQLPVLAALKDLFFVSQSLQYRISCYPSHGDRFRVIDPNVEGFAVFLGVYVHCMDVQIEEFTEAILLNLLCEVELNSDPTLYWSKHIQTLLSWVQSPAVGDAQGNQPRTTKLLKLLVKFVKQLINPTVFYRTSIKTRAGEYKISAAIQNDSNSKADDNSRLIYVFRSRSVSLGNLRQRIATDLGVSYFQVLIKSISGKLLTMDRDASLLEDVIQEGNLVVQISNEISIKISPFSPARCVWENESSIFFGIRSQLSESVPFIQRILDLLSGENAESFFTLSDFIDLLPPNSTMQQSIIVAWESINRGEIVLGDPRVFDIDTPGHFAYFLVVLNKLLDGSAGPTQKDLAKSLSANGVVFLLQKFASYNNHNKDGLISNLFATLCSGRLADIISKVIKRASHSLEPGQISDLLLTAQLDISHLANGYRINDVLVQSALLDCLIAHIDILSALCELYPQQVSEIAQNRDLLVTLTGMLSLIAGGSAVRYFEHFSQLISSTVGCSGRIPPILQEALVSPLRVMDSQLGVTTYSSYFIFLARLLQQNDSFDADFQFKIFSLSFELLLGLDLGGCEVFIANVFQVCLTILSNLRASGVSKSLFGNHSISFFERVIGFIFHACMFDFPNDFSQINQVPKCKSAFSRSISLQLLKEILQCADSAQLDSVMLNSVHSQFAQLLTERISFEEDSDFHVKNADSYTGIENPGCICYMISTLQQFFMMPLFRKLILAIPPNIVESEVLRQIQLIFGTLQESFASKIDITSFCKSIKNYDGTEIDVFVQHDASEFLSNFIQNIENAISGTQYCNILSQTVAGELINELRAEDDRYSSRPELFYFVSVGVGPGRSNLHDSLLDFIKDETVDYSWTDDSNQKKFLPTKKRTLFKKLPQCLIIHLKRFEFDFEVMTQVKLNDRFEFPQLLDMFPFTIDSLDPDREDLDRSDYQYQLAGIVIHMGTASTGHYYSFIKERSGGNQKWFEFNDSIISDFSADWIETEAFGGSERMTDDKNARMKTRNAFMLFYDKVPRAVALQEAALIDPSMPRFRAPLSSDILDAVWHKNRHLLNKSFLISESYFSFLYDIVCDRAAQSEEERIDTCLNIFTVLLKMTSSGKSGGFIQLEFDRWYSFISNTLRSSPSASKSFLAALTDTSSSLLKSLILERFHESLSKKVFALILSAIESNSNEPEIHYALVGKLCLQLLSPDFLNATQENSQALNPWYFSPLVKFIGQYPEAPSLLLKHQILETLIRTVIQNHISSASVAPAPKASLQSVSKLHGLISVQLLSLIGVLIHYARHSPDSPEAKSTSDSNTILSEPVFVQWMTRFTRKPSNKEQVSQILSDILTDNQDSTANYVNLIIDLIIKEDGANLKAAWRMALLVCQIPDSLQEWRVHLLLKGMTEVLVAQAKYSVATEIGLEMLLRIAKHSSIAREFLVHWLTPDQMFAWVQSWVKNSDQLSDAWKAQPTSPSSTPGKSRFLLKQSFNSISSLNGRNSKVALLLAFRHLAFEGSLPRDLEYDSDDELGSMIGKRVSFRIGESKWFSGVIRELDEKDADVVLVENFHGQVQRLNTNFHIWRILP